MREKLKANIIITLVFLLLKGTVFGSSEMSMGLQVLDPPKKKGIKLDEEGKENTSPVKNKEKNDDKAPLKYFSKYQVSKKYMRGKHLIYDCNKRNFACVDDVGVKNCRIERDSEIKKSENLILPCAPLKTFADVDECIKNQYTKQHRKTTKSFCINKQKRDNY